MKRLRQQPLLHRKNFYDFYKKFPNFNKYKKIFFKQKELSLIYFLVNYSARYLEMARSLARFMLSSNFDFLEKQQFELFNLYDVHIFYRAGATN